MGIRYYKLFDLLNRRGMKKSDLREILSPKTVSKLSKGEYLSGEAIEKICLFLSCQPGDIMEVVETEELDEGSQIISVSTALPDQHGTSITDTYGEFKPFDLSIAESDAEDMTQRSHLGTNY